MTAEIEKVVRALVCVDVQLYRIDSRARAKPNILLECRKEAFAAELVKNGFGIAFYPESAHPIGKSEGVCTRELHDLNVIRSIYASWPRRFSLNSAAMTFINFAVDYFDTTE